MQRISFLNTSAAALALLVAACHHHDSNSSSGSGGATTTLTAGVLGDTPLRTGERVDILITRSDGMAPNLDTWEIVSGQTDGTLVDLGVADSMRFVAPPTLSGGQGDTYRVRVTSTDGDSLTFPIDVVPDDLSLVIDEAMAGDDMDEVEASMAGSRDHMFLAERIGGSAAPQLLVRINRAGDRETEIQTLFKVEDLSASSDGRVTVMRVGATLTESLVRYDQDLVEDTTFNAPDLGTGVAWQLLVAMTRTGDTIVATDIDGGSLLRLAPDGTPFMGDVMSSLLPLPVAYADVVDLAVDADDSIYVATPVGVARVLASGAVDTDNWEIPILTDVRGVTADDRGSIYVFAQDADAGQCGSLRRLDWTGTVVRRITEFDNAGGAAEFAARKILDPLACGAFADGEWRLYDDIVTLNPNFPRASWMLSGRYDEVE